MLVNTAAMNRRIKIFQVQIADALPIGFDRFNGITPA